MMQQLYLSNYAQQFGSLLILLLGLVLLLKRQLPIQILTIYGALGFAFQLSGDLLAIGQPSRYMNLNNNLYILSETLVLLFFFYHVFTTKGLKNMATFFAVAYFLSYFFWLAGHWNDFVSSTRTTRDIIMIICALFYFYYLMAERPTLEITKFPMFWVIASMLCFFSGTFVLSLSLDYLVKTFREDVTVLWTMRNYFRFLFCLVICYGMWLDLKQTKQTLYPTK